jgi:predicted enzyme related to lactoylglutathione lyase
LADRRVATVVSTTVDRMSTPTTELVGAGIGVTDLDRSVAFYCTVFGFEDLSRFELPTMVNVLVGNPGEGAVVVLMCHTDGVKRDFANTGGKLAFRVSDPAATAPLACEHGASMLMEPVRFPHWGNAMIGMVADPDGHPIELLEL